MTGTPTRERQRLDVAKLLLELTALAFTLSLGGPDAASSVPQIAQDIPSYVRQIDIAPSTVPTSVQGELSQLTPVDVSLLPQLSGRALLDQFAILPQSTLAQFISTHPDTIANLLAAPPAAKDVSAWWVNVSADTRETFLQEAPELVGNLDGVPFGTRNLANRTYLTTAIDALEEQLQSGVGRGMNVETTNHLHMLTQIESALRSNAGDPTRTLVTLDTASPGRAAIVIGDLSTADYVSYLIPGMFFTIDGQVDDWADTATGLYQDQTAWLERLGEESSTVATVAWMGYQTPHLLNVGSLDLAESGARYLADALTGLNTLRASDEPYVSVMAHSYGSTAAMIALQHGSVQIDALAIVGSPGSDAQSVSSLAVRDANVFVGEAGWDPVVNSAFFGSDPGATSYGAYRMGVSGGTDTVTAASLSPSYGHNEYFRPGSESLRNMALIGIGQGGLVMNDSGLTIAAAGR